MASEPQYRLYIDESGDHTFDRVEDPAKRYLCLMGIWFDRGEPYRQFADYLERLKRAFFNSHPDEPVCLHRSDIIGRKGPFGVLRDAKVATKFDRGLIWIVGRCSYRMCAVVIDKKSHKDKTYRTLRHPYHYCLAALLERYCGWLEFHGFTGDVMAESRGGTEDREFRKAFEDLYNHGTRFHSSKRIRAVLTSKKPKLKKKEHNIAGLQLCDILAAPARREITGNRRFKEGMGARLLDAARGNFNCHEYTRATKGYGKVLLK